MITRDHVLEPRYQLLPTATPQGATSHLLGGNWGPRYSDPGRGFLFFPFPDRSRNKHTHRRVFTSHRCPPPPPQAQRPAAPREPRARARDHARVTEGAETVPQHPQTRAWMCKARPSACAGREITKPRRGVINPTTCGAKLPSRLCSAPPVQAESR